MYVGWEWKADGQQLLRQGIVSINSRSRRWSTHHASIIIIIIIINIIIIIISLAFARLACVCECTFV